MRCKERVNLWDSHYGPTKTGASVDRSVSGRLDTQKMRHTIKEFLVGQIRIHADPLENSAKAACHMRITGSSVLVTLDNIVPELPVITRESECGQHEYLIFRDVRSGRSHLCLNCLRRRTKGNTVERVKTRAVTEKAREGDPERILIFSRDELGQNDETAVVPELMGRMVVTVIPDEPRLGNPICLALFIAEGAVRRVTGDVSSQSERLQVDHYLQWCRPGHKVFCVGSGNDNVFMAMLGLNGKLRISSVCWIIPGHRQGLSAREGYTDSERTRHRGIFARRLKFPLLEMLEQRPLESESRELEGWVKGRH